MRLKAEELLSVITSDNIIYSQVAREYSTYCDKYYEAVIKCFDIQRVNF